MNHLLDQEAAREQAHNELQQVSRRIQTKRKTLLNWVTMLGNAADEINPDGRIEGVHDPLEQIESDLDTIEDLMKGEYRRALISISRGFCNSEVLDSMLSLEIELAMIHPRIFEVELILANPKIGVVS